MATDVTGVYNACAIHVQSAIFAATIIFESLTMKTAGLVVAVAIASTMFAGCGSAKRSNRDPVFKTAGRVIYKSKPVSGADVTFVCAEKDRSAFGRTDEEGRFKLTTFVPNDGAIAGKHVVVVTKIEQSAAPPAPDLHDPAYDPNTAGVVSRIPPKNQIPQRYQSPKTSDLFVVITDDGSTSDIELELKD